MGIESPLKVAKVVIFCVHSKQVGVLLDGFFCVFFQDELLKSIIIDSDVLLEINLCHIDEKCLSIFWLQLTQ